MCTLEKRGNIFILTLTGEDDHRLGLPLISTLRTTLDQIRSEAKPGSVLITTAQGKFFSNGFDLAYAAQPNGSINIPRLREMVDGFKPIVSDFLTLPLPTIAVVSGHAAAAGFMLALVHDYVLMRKDRGVLYMSEINIGLTFPDYFMALMKSKITSPTARRDVVLRAAKLTAEKAVELGIIDSAYENLEETMKAGLKLGEELASKKWKAAAAVVVVADAVAADDVAVVAAAAVAVVAAAVAVSVVAVVVAGVGAAAAEYILYCCINQSQCYIVALTTIHNSSTYRL